ncbi:hypothetical protein [Micromonospora sp. NPDC051296]|uniref:hypothetical protein n=1 Tax=Micromonospora sp. NPDC051296 TaxID=3155046 RepID=UPI00342CCF46
MASPCCRCAARASRIEASPSAAWAVRSSEAGQRGELYELALRSIEQVDFQVSADLSDFLAEPEMAAEYERIERLLTA